MSKNETAAAAAEPARNAKVTLDTPIRRGDQTITEISLRKPAAGELRGLQLADLLRLDVSSLQLLIPRVSSPTLTSHDVAQLDVADLVQIGGQIVNFFVPRKDRESLPE